MLLKALFFINSVSAVREGRDKHWQCCQKRLCVRTSIFAQLMAISR